MSTRTSWRNLKCGHLKLCEGCPDSLSLWMQPAILRCPACLAVLCSTLHLVWKSGQALPGSTTKRWNVNDMSCDSQNSTHPPFFLFSATGLCSLKPSWPNNIVSFFLFFTKFKDLVCMPETAEEIQFWGCFEWCPVSRIQCRCRLYAQ